MLKGPDLAPHVYDELRRLAAVQMRGQAVGHTLQPTALVSEAWLKLAAHPEKSRRILRMQPSFLERSRMSMCISSRGVEGSHSKTLILQLSTTGRHHSR